MTQPRDSRTRRPTRGKYIPKRKVCFFCRDKVLYIDYKDPAKLRPYISDRGKITAPEERCLCQTPACAGYRHKEGEASGFVAVCRGSGPQNGGNELVYY